MPSETIITCDICGADDARQYSAPFWIRDANEHEFVGVGRGLMQKVPYEPLLDAAPIVSAANWVGPNPYRVYLCKEHYESWIAACYVWLASARGGRLKDQ